MRVRVESRGLIMSSKSTHSLVRDAAAALPDDACSPGVGARDDARHDTRNGRPNGDRPGSLYVVATPIGHLSDVSHRAETILRTVRTVAAEDTRVSRVLLDHVGSRATMTSVHRHNETASIQGVLARLAAGEDVALITDAGTPAISDPGAWVVDAAHRAGYPVVPIPGPSAPTALLSAAGLPPGPSVFAGFLPTRAGERARRLAAMQGAADSIGASLVLFEAPHRIEALLAALADTYEPERMLVIGRELTKRFEQIRRCAIGEAGAWLRASDDHRRGEFVLAIAPRTPSPDSAAAPQSEDIRLSMRTLLSGLMADMPLSQAVKCAQRLTARPHRELYALALAVRERAGN